MKKYNIICHDGKSFEISEEQKNNFIKISSTNAKGAEINGNFITFSSVARIEKTGRKEYKKFDYKPRLYTKQRYIRNLKDLRDGFLRGVSNRNNLKSNQKPILKKINNAINQAINSNQTKFTVDAKLFGY
jgi:hypothetical protein